MWRNRSDQQVLDRLLAGDVDPLVVAESHQALAATLAAASAAASGDEFVAPAGMLATLARTAATQTPKHDPARSPRARRRFVRRVTVLTACGALVLSGALASFGALPDAAQSVAHTMLGKIGINVPGPNENAGEHPFERGKSGKPKTNVPGQSEIRPTPEKTQGPKPGPGEGNGNEPSRPPKPEHPTPSPQAGNGSSNGSGNAPGAGR